jgi:diaminohydroxyphosphoribosylaminopyrimidine deaminase/5-amino-6-(5-phosphoribosylamino)uracil reductase
MLDPFPQVAGKGTAQLRGAGVDVEIGIGGPAARSMNAPYLKLLRADLPWVHAKWAMTLDGKIATRTGQSKWITGEAARTRVHELRGRMDAIIVGSGTVIADDPLLTARPAGPRIATRVILSTGSQPLPFPCHLTLTISEAPVLIFTTKENVPALEAFRNAGCEIVAIDREADGNLSIKNVLAELGRRRMTNVLVEGGRGVLGKFFDARAVDEVWAFVAPKLFGGVGAIGPIGGQGIGEVGESVAIQDCEVERVGEDVLLHGRIAGNMKDENKDNEVQSSS